MHRLRETTTRRLNLDLVGAELGARVRMAA
jgi:hypothetical protein